MSQTLAFAAAPDFTYRGMSPAKDLAEPTIAQAWDITGQDKAAMVAALAPRL